jgi:hypothetical protein
MILPIDGKKEAVNYEELSENKKKGDARGCCKKSIDIVPVCALAGRYADNLQQWRWKSDSNNSGGNSRRMGRFSMG